MIVSDEKFLIDVRDYRMLVLWSDGYMVWEASETVDYESLEEDMEDLKKIKEKYLNVKEEKDKKKD